MNGTLGSLGAGGSKKTTIRYIRCVCLLLGIPAKKTDGDFLFDFQGSVVSLLAGLKIV